MAGQLPALSLESFSVSLRSEVAGGLSDAVVSALWAHYGELRRWGPRLSLIGPGTLDSVLARHYGESLAALDWCPEAPLRHVDVGSGGGFPGFVLAAARPEWQTTLVEPRERKWAFLQAAVRSAQLSCRCLNARVDAHLPDGLPEGFDVVTVRALRLGGDAWGAIIARLAPGARVLWWLGDEGEGLPAGLRLVESRPLAGSRVRRIVWAEPC